MKILTESIQRVFASTKPSPETNIVDAQREFHETTIQEFLRARTGIVESSDVDFICGEESMRNSCELCRMNLNHMENMVEFNKTNPRHHPHTIAFDGIVRMSFLETGDHVFHFVEFNMTKITRVCEALATDGIHET